MSSYVESQALDRIKNLADSLIRTPHDDQGRVHDVLTDRELSAYSIVRGLAALYAHHNPGFKSDAPTWVDSLEYDANNRLKRQRVALGEHVAEGDLLIPPEVLRRSMSTTPGAKGGYLVGSHILAYDDLLRARSVALRAGAQRIEVTGGASITVPTQVTASTPGWQAGDGASVAASAGTLTQLSATPKTLIVIVEVPHQLMTQAGPAGEFFIVDGLTKDEATEIDAKILAGTGASGAPLGIISTPGIGSVAGAAIDYDKCVEFQTDVSDNNAVLNASTLRYVTTPSVAALLKSRQRFTGTDSPLWKGSIHEGEVEGVIAMSTKNMPAATMLFGDFSACVLLEWGPLRLQINPYADLGKALVSIRAMRTVDVLVRYPLSFSLATSIT